MSSPVKFGGVFEVDLAAGELRKHGLRIKLADQPFSLLSVLLRRAGEVVTRDELQRELWPADTFVDFERGLNKAMNRLRDALGDSADAPRFIETIPKRGYRFIGQIDDAGDDARDDERRVDRSADSSILQARPYRRAIAIVLGLLVPVAIAVFVSTRRATDAQPLVRSSLLPPPNTSFLPYNFALSPDGTQLAFVAEVDGRQSLWVRSLSTAQATPLGDTDGAAFPFWAPDNRRLGFFADRKLKTIDTAGGVVRIIADIKRPSGATWSSDGVIVFAPDVSGPLYQVAATGGTPSPVTQVSNALETQRWPFFLPDGRHFLYSADNAQGVKEAQGIFVASLDSPQPMRLSPDVARSATFALDRVFFVRGRTLTALTFDAARLQLIGQPMSIAERDVASASAFFPSGFSISNTGLLAFQSATDLASRLIWTNPDGNALEELPDGMYFDPSVSPDGRQVAMSCDQLDNATTSICVYDVARRVVSRVTPGPADRFPVWSPDGGEIVYASGNGSFRVNADGSTAPQPVATRNNPSSWLGRNVLSFGTDSGVVSLAVTSLDDGRITDLGEGSEGQFSPDGTWIAHNGPDGIVVRQYPGPGARISISGYGGHQPRWSRDGKRLYYVRQDRTLMVVDFDPALGRASAPRALFRTRIVAAGFIGHQYDVTPDGRFLINTLKSTAPPLTLLTGWTRSLAH